MGSSVDHILEGGDVAEALTRVTIKPTVRHGTPISSRTGVLEQRTADQATA